jgi:SAM-dependent methyltransferase
LPYRDDTFTKACTVNTIYFWPDAAAALREMRRALCAGGRLVVTFNPPATAGKLPYTRHGFTLYEPEQVRALLVGAGFHDVALARGTSRLGDFFAATGSK